MGSVVMLPKDESRHLSQVLRLRPGDEAIVFDGRGNQYLCRVELADRSSAKLQILEPVARTNESPLNLTLVQALAKGDKFDLIVQKATELGVTAIVPLVTERSEVRLSPEQAERKVERWRRISLEAVKQCGRSTLVDIHLPLSVAEFLITARTGYTDEEPSSSRPLARSSILVFNEHGGASISDALASSPGSASMTVLVGPEGGWAERELAELASIGCVSVNLGPRILRMETAAIVALALIQSLIGDLALSRPTDKLA